MYKNYKGFSDKLSYNHPIIIYNAWISLNSSVSHSQTFRTSRNLTEPHITWPPITSFKQCWTYSYPWPIELTEPPRTSLVLLKVHCKDMIAPITHVCYSGHTQYAELLKWTDFLRVLCLLCSQLAVHALTQKRSKVHFRSNFLSQWSSVTILHPHYPLPVQGFWPLSSPLAWT